MKIFDEGKAILGVLKIANKREITVTNIEFVKSQGLDGERVKWIITLPRGVRCDGLYRGLKNKFNFIDLVVRNETIEESLRKKVWNGN